MKEGEHRGVGLLGDAEVVEGALAGREPIELEAAGLAARAEVAEDCAPARGEEIRVSLLVARVAKIEAAQDRVAGELGGAGDVAAARGFGLREREELAGAPARIAPHPAMDGPEKSIAPRWLCVHVRPVRPRLVYPEAALRPRIMSAAFSAIMTMGAWVLPPTIVGMIEPSTTRMPSRPRTLSSESTTDFSSLPILHVPTG